jgi:hypothetical protein
VGKLAYLAEELGEGNLSVMRAVKAALDPRGVLNPGKKVPVEGAGAGAGAVELAPPCDCEQGHKPLPGAWRGGDASGGRA